MYSYTYKYTYVDYELILKKMVELHFGRFFHKLIWSSCSSTWFCDCQEAKFLEMLTTFWRENDNFCSIAVFRPSKLSFCHFLNEYLQNRNIGPRFLLRRQNFCPKFHFRSKTWFGFSHINTTDRYLAKALLGKSTN
jgi:hypothetical protein